ncbi:hypothetical protein KVV02_002890, partial [Mortierella alpina]
MVRNRIVSSARTVDAIACIKGPYRLTILPVDLHLFTETHPTHLINMKTSLIAILVPLFGLIASAEMHAKHTGGEEASSQSVACPTRDKVKWYIDKLTELTYNGLRACDCPLCSQCSRCSEHLKPEIREILHKLESMEATVLPMLTRDSEDLNACINAPLPDSSELADCKSDLATCEIDKD